MVAHAIKANTARSATAEPTANSPMQQATLPAGTHLVATKNAARNGDEGALGAVRAGAALDLLRIAADTFVSAT